MSAAACSAARAEVIRWNDAGQGGEVQLAALETSIQRYDAQGVERQPPCPRATTILAGFQAAEVGVLFGFLG